MDTNDKDVTPLQLIQDMETFIKRFVTFHDEYAFPISLWTICTYLWPNFDAFPYMVITSTTKRSGKTRTAELISFMCSNPRSFGAMTASTIFSIIDEFKPTIFFDEAEVLSQENAGVMRSVLNMGYRKGQKVPRKVGKQVVEFETYCPKVFILIGDTFDTLMDRSIIVRMQRAEAKERFTYEAVKTEGEEIRCRIDEMLHEKRSEIVQAFQDFKGVPFLTDRDEEIWTPIFVLASVLCPERLPELSRIAVDMATEKTQERKRYFNLKGAEQGAEQDEYSQKLLADLRDLVGEEKNIGTADALKRLHAIPTSPWRRFKEDEGLNAIHMGDMLSRFGVSPTTIRTKEGKVMKGYKREQIIKSCEKHGIK